MNGKPTYCSLCFKKGDNGGNRSADQYKAQFEMLNSKLDKILKALTPTASVNKAPEVKAEKIEKVEKAEPEKTAAKPKKAAKKAAAKKKK